jgi:hypothetical protein
MRLYRWLPDYGALSAAEIRKRFGGPQIRITEWNCRKSDGWKFGGTRECTWICLNGSCKVVFHHSDSDRPPSEEAFWLADGVLLRRGDIVELDQCRYVLSVLTDEVEATLFKVFNLKSLIGSLV